MTSGSATPGAATPVPATAAGLAAWDEAQWVARLCALAPAGSGVHVRARPGPARDRFLALLRDALPPGAPLRRCPAGIADARLLGGLDLAASLAAGRSVIGRGLLAESDGGLVLVGGAERLDAGTAARLAAVLDAGEVAVERDGISTRHPARIGLVLLDEAGDDPDAAQLPATLRDRLAFRLDLDALPPGGDSATPPDPGLSQAPLPPAQLLDALCGTAEALGVASPRATLLALRAARGCAALHGRAAPAEADVVLAARLVLLPRATRLPASPDADPGPPAPADDTDSADTPPGPRDTPPDDAAQAEGRAGDPPAPPPGPDEPAAPPSAAPPPGDAAAAVIAATLAALPPSLLARLGAAGPATRTAESGRAAGRARASRHGRPVGSRPGRPDGGARLDLLATLRAAAPLQALRRRDAQPPPPSPGRAARLHVRAADLRVQRRESTPRATTLFVVDASGSAAMSRLAEAKGAVELLLAECYVRRDQVALLAFRGAGAELLLPPTGALARARRCLAALPGGGPTPIAAGLDAAAQLAASLRRRGAAPLLVVLTDGRANIARDGTADRARATADALDAARGLRASGLPALLIDISARPQPQAAALAEAMGARCLFLPRADAAALSRAIRQAA